MKKMNETVNSLKMGNSPYFFPSSSLWCAWWTYFLTKLSAQLHIRYYRAILSNDYRYQYRGRQKNINPDCKQKNTYFHKFLYPNWHFFHRLHCYFHHFHPKNHLLNLVQSKSKVKMNIFHLEYVVEKCYFHHLRNYLIMNFPARYSTNVPKYPHVDLCILELKAVPGEYSWNLS